MRVGGCTRLLAEARTARQRAIALDGRCKAHNDRLAHAEALSDCSSAIRADDDYPYSYTNRGIAQASLGNHLAAIGDFTRAHVLRPTFGWILANRAKSHASLGNTAAAIGDYEEALRLKPDLEEARASLEQLRGGQGSSPGVAVTNTLCGSVGCQ